MLNDALGFCCQKWLDDKELKNHPGKCSEHHLKNLEAKVRNLTEQLDISQSLHKKEFDKVRRYDQVCVEIRSILEEAIESLDKNEPVNGLAWAIGLLDKVKN